METITRRAMKSKQKSEPAAGRRIGPEAVTEQETEWNRGDSHLNAISLLPGHAFDRQTRSSFPAKPRDKGPHLARGVARLPFGAV